MGEPTAAQRHLCRRHGGRLERLRPPSRPGAATDLLRREWQAAAHPQASPRRAIPGHPAHHDTEYGRAGDANIFLACAPHDGWRQAAVTARRTAIDVAYQLRDLADVHFPETEVIVLVTDQLNVHAAASLYAAFPPPRRGVWPTASSGITPPPTVRG
jgi:hypothetical protein